MRQSTFEHFLRISIKRASLYDPAVVSDDHWSVSDKHFIDRAGLYVGAGLIVKDPPSGEAIRAFS